MQKNNPKTPQKTKNKQTKFKTKTKNKTSRNHALARYVIFSAIQDCYSYLNSCPQMIGAQQICTCTCNFAVHKQIARDVD